MRREAQVRICERLGVKLPGPTRQSPCRSLFAKPGPGATSILTEQRRLPSPLEFDRHRYRADVMQRLPGRAETAANM